MEKKETKLLLFFVLTFISFFIFRWFYLDVMYFRLVSYIGNKGLSVLENTLVALVIFTIGTLFLSSTLFQFVYKEFNYALLKIEYTVYFGLLFFFLFFKSKGVQGVSMNPFSFIQDFFSGQSIEVLANIVFFIPLGLLFNYKNVRLSKSLLICTITIILVETVQFIFSLGFFDLGDVSTNIGGILIGWILYLFFYKRGYKIIQ